MNSDDVWHDNDSQERDCEDRPERTGKLYCTRMGVDADGTGDLGRSNYQWTHISYVSHPSHLNYFPRNDITRQGRRNAIFLSS